MLVFGRAWPGNPVRGEKTMTKTMPVSVIDGARALLRRPGAWTQNAEARNAKGQVVLLLAKDATCFCLWGALARAGHDLEAERPGFLQGESVADAVWAVQRALEERRYTPEKGGLIDWNDKVARNQNEVLGVLLRAREKALEGLEGRWTGRGQTSR